MVGIEKSARESCFSSREGRRTAGQAQAGKVGVAANGLAREAMTRTSQSACLDRQWAAADGTLRNDDEVALDTGGTGEQV